MIKRVVVLIFGSFVVLAVAAAAAQKPDGPPSDGMIKKTMSDLEKHYRQLDADVSLLREDVTGLSKNLDWLSRNLSRPGMILPYHGPLSDAVALEKEGWFVCDGRPITDPSSAVRFKSKTTPDFQNRLLKGSKESGAFTGHDSVTTTSNGRHDHLLPEKWYARGQEDKGGKYSGVDTNGPVEHGKPPVQANGDHTHTVKMDPLAYTVIYLMYVREVTGRP
jgi:hypothetical protein